MPRARTEPQRWQEELDELPAQIARWKKELGSLTTGDRLRREMLEWMVRRDQLRMETLRRWLASSSRDASCGP